MRRVPWGLAKACGGNGEGNRMIETTGDSAFGNDTAHDNRIDRRKILAAGLASSTALTPVVRSAGLVPGFGSATSGLTDCDESLIGTWEEVCEPVTVTRAVSGSGTLNGVGTGRFDVTNTDGAASFGTSTIRAVVAAAMATWVETASVSFDGELTLYENYCLAPRPKVATAMGTVDLSGVQAGLDAAVAEIEASNDLQNVAVANGSYQSQVNLSFLSSSSTGFLSNFGSPRFDVVGTNTATFDNYATGGVIPWVEGGPCYIRRCAADPCIECTPYPTLSDAVVVNLAISLDLSIEITADYVGSEFSPRRVTFEPQGFGGLSYRGPTLTLDEPFTSTYGGVVTCV